MMHGSPTRLATRPRFLHSHLLLLRQHWGMCRCGGLALEDMAKTATTPQQSSMPPRPYVVYTLDIFHKSPILA